MHFIELTRTDKKNIIVNIEKIVEIVDLKKFRRILFAIQIDNDYGYEDVVETTEEIMVKGYKAL